MVVDVSTRYLINAARRWLGLFRRLADNTNKPADRQATRFLLFRKLQAFLEPAAVGLLAHDRAEQDEIVAECIGVFGRDRAELRLILL